jgi:hypothetical protein
MAFLRNGCLRSSPRKLPTDQAATGGISLQEEIRVGLSGQDAGGAFFRQGLIFLFFLPFFSPIPITKTGRLS